MNSHFFTVCAGMFAALAGVCGKLAADSAVIDALSSNQQVRRGGGGLVVIDVV